MVFANPVALGLVNPVMNAAGGSEWADLELAAIKAVRAAGFGTGRTRSDAIAAGLVNANPTASAQNALLPRTCTITREDVERMMRIEK